MTGQIAYRIVGDAGFSDGKWKGCYYQKIDLQTVDAHIISALGTAWRSFEYEFEFITAQSLKGLSSRIQAFMRIRPKAGERLGLWEMHGGLSLVGDNWIQGVRRIVVIPDE